MNRNDLIVIAGAGGFIGGHLVKYIYNLGFRNIRAIDKKPVPLWYQQFPVENLCLDLSEKENAERAVEDADEVYNFAADMGGMGFIEKFRIECMRSVLINTHLLEASYQAGVSKYLFSSSACVLNTDLQKDPNVKALKESDAYPSKAEIGYGEEKLFSERLCEQYYIERGMKTFIPRFFNIYGTYGTWDGGREKAPAAICRKIIESKYNNNHEITIWGDGNQVRNFTWIDDCIHGLDYIMDCEDLIATPVNLGSAETVTINRLVDIVEDIAEIKVLRKYDLSAPKGVAGRGSDNTFIESVLHWQPSTPLIEGMRRTYSWIENEYLYKKKYLL